MNECKDCKHEGQRCEAARIGSRISHGCPVECYSFTPKIPTENLQDPLTVDEIYRLDIRLCLEDCEFVINNRNQTIKAIKLALQNQPDNRPALEKMLLQAIENLQDCKEKETSLLQKMAEIQK